jgi:hypothetical protein
MIAGQRVDRPGNPRGVTFVKENVAPFARCEGVRMTIPIHDLLGSVTFHPPPARAAKVLPIAHALFWNARSLPRRVRQGFP